MSDDKIILMLAWTYGPPPYRGGTVTDPVWDSLEERIANVFLLGGSVELSSTKQVYEPRPGLLMIESVTMWACPGEFRITVSPEATDWDTHVLREWWEPGDTPDRGTVRFRDDDVWDARTICTNADVARIFFKEFFEAKKITKYIIDNTK